MSNFTRCRNHIKRQLSHLATGVAGVLTFLAVSGSETVQAQCVPITLINQIDTCPYTQVTLDPAIDTTLASPREFTWTPASGLSSTNTLFTIATTAISDITYYLDIKGLLRTNLVQNASFGNGNMQFTSDYTYSTAGLTQGQYGINTNPQNMVGTLAPYGDHTTGTGNMMIVKGSTTAGKNVWCQTIPVTANSEYNFSFWAASADATNPASLQVKINGVDIGSAFALPTTTGVWNQYSVDWPTALATSADVCISNSNVSFNGNAFTIDDLEFRKYCHSEDSIVIKLHPVDVSFTFNKAAGCAEDTVYFNATNNVPGTTVTYSWVFGDGTFGTGQNTTHIYGTQGAYNVILSATNGKCSENETQTVDTNNPLTASFEVDEDSVCAGAPVTFNSNSIGTITNYAWDYGDGHTGTGQITQHTYDTVGYFTATLVITSNLGCTDTTTLNILVEGAAAVTAAISDSNFCLGTPIKLDAYISSNYDSAYWDIGGQRRVYDDLHPFHTFDQSGVYEVTFNAFFRSCPDSIFKFPVNVYAYPKVNLGPDTSLCPGERPLYISDSYSHADGTTYLWNTGDTTKILRMPNPNTYWLRVTEPSGCSNTDSIWVRKACYVDVPNSFTPNGDGLNDYFLPRQLLSYKLTRFEMQVFDRWGVRVFETKDLEGRGWDGKLNGVDQPLGAYVYVIDVSYANGREERLKGTVTLIR